MSDTSLKPTFSKEDVENVICALEDSFPRIQFIDTIAKSMEDYSQQCRAFHKKCDEVVDNISQFLQENSITKGNALRDDLFAQYGKLVEKAGKTAALRLLEFWETHRPK